MYVLQIIYNKNKIMRNFNSYARMLFYKCNSFFLWIKNVSDSKYVYLFLNLLLDQIESNCSLDMKQYTWE